MVAYEVTRNLDKPGSQILQEWLSQHDGLGVLVVTTKVLVRYQRRQQDNPMIKSRNRGEIAAAAVLRDRELSTGLTGALIFDDAGVNTTPFLMLLPPLSLIISLSEFLQGLETDGFVADAADVRNAFHRSTGQSFYKRVARAASGEEVVDWHLP